MLTPTVHYTTEGGGLRSFPITPCKSIWRMEEDITVAIDAARAEGGKDVHIRIEGKRGFKLRVHVDARSS